MTSSISFTDRAPERKHRLRETRDRAISRIEATLAPGGPLLLRLWLAQEFIQAGYIKLGDGWRAPEWFSGLAFPLPVRWLSADVNWVTAGLLEVTLGTLLLLGLFGRTAAIGLLFVTYVAVYSVHFDLGWAGWNQIETDAGQGFKVPLMLALMLVALLAGGMGRWSLDAWWRRQASRQ